jgi:ABC-type transport system substrate-binding protein
LDETTVLPNALASMKQQNPKAAVYKLPPAAVGTLFFPLGDSTSAFQDIRVRQGLSMAIDYDAIGKSVFNGEFTRCLFVSPSLGKWSLSLDQLDASVKQNYQYNPGEAKKLLDAAGATGQTFKFAFINSGVSPSQSWAITEASALANMFHPVGMKLQQLPIDFTKDYIDTGKGYRQGYFDKDVMFFFNAQTFNEVDEAIYNYFDSKSTQSGEHLQDSALDDMIAKARTVVDENQRLQAYLDIQKYIESKVYTLVLGGGPNYTMIQPRVQNYAVSTSYTAMAESYAKVWLQQ